MKAMQILDSQLANNPIQTDAFRNPVARTGLGTQNLINATQYTRTKITNNLALLNNLYRSNWIVKNMVDIIPEDMTKTWFQVTGSLEPEEITKIATYQADINLKESVVQGLKWGRLYGGALGLILLRNQEDLSLPIDYNRIMPDDFRGLYIVDRWSGVYPDETVVTSDLNDPNFGKPEYYYVEFLENTILQVRVHHSRLIRFNGRDIPKNQYAYEHFWGESILEPVYEEIIKRDNVSNNMVSLTFKANLSIYSVNGLAAQLSTGNSNMQRRFFETIQAQSVLESNEGIRVIDSEDTFQQAQYNFAGLKDVYETVQQDLAGACSIPVVKLFQRSPSGLNATGKADLQMYNDRLTIERETSLKPIIKQLLPIICLSSIGKLPEDLEFKFEAIRNPDELEKANIAQKQVAVILDTYTENLIDKETALQNLKTLGESTGVLDNISDTMISDGYNIYYSEPLNDPIAGLGASRTQSLLSQEKEPENAGVYEYSEDL